MQKLSVSGIALIFGTAWSQAPSSGSPKSRSPEVDPITNKESTNWVDRMENNKADFHRLKQVDSVGWIKVLSLRGSTRNLEDLKQEQEQRKLAAMTEYCSESRFGKLGEVDSIPKMTLEERAYCKSRLKTANPSIK